MLSASLNKTFPSFIPQGSSSLHHGLAIHGLGFEQLDLMFKTYFPLCSTIQLLLIPGTFDLVSSCDLLVTF